MDDEYKRFTIRSLKDKASGAYSVDTYDRDAKALERALKSALPKDAFYYMRPKNINYPSGKFREDFYIKQEYASVAYKAMSRVAEKMLFDKYDIDSNKYSLTRARKLTDEESKLVKELEEANKQNKDSKDGEGIRFNRGTLLKIFGAITALTAVVKRILSSVLANASQSAKDAIQAHNLGMGYRAVREARYIEKAHGMREGTLPNAYSEVVQAFGNVTELDTEKLEKLAIVMGGKIRDMAMSGLAVSDPDKLVGAIVDAFNEQANKGYTSTGVYVGEEQARKELYTYLSRYFPNIADIFASLQETQRSVTSIYKDVHDYQSWKDVLDTNRGNFPQAYFNVEVSTGKLEGKVDAILTQIKQGLMLELNPTIFGLLQKIADVRWGLTGTENAELNKKNAEATEKYIKVIEGVLGTYTGKNLTADEKAFKEELEDELKKAKSALKDYKELGADIADMTKPLDLIRVNASRRIDQVNEVIGTKRLFEAQQRAIAENLSEEEIENSRKKLTGIKREQIMTDINTRQEEINKQIDKERSDRIKQEEQKKKDLFTVLDTALINQGVKDKNTRLSLIQQSHPELITTGVLDTFGNKVANFLGIPQKAGYVTNFKLTEDEQKGIEAEVEGHRKELQEDLEKYKREQKYIYDNYEPSEKEVTQFIMENYPAIAKKVQSYVKQLAMEGMGEVAGSSLFALYMNHDLDETLENNIPSDFESSYVGYGAYVEGRTKKDTATGEVVHKIVLVYDDKSGEHKEFLLGEYFGYDGANKIIGQLEMKRTAEGKTDYTITQADGASNYKQ